MSARIRWTEDADVVPIGGPLSAWQGRVGNLDSYLFLITTRSLGGDDYALCTELPWMGKRRSYDPDPDKLKAEAERWLSGFVSSLGAIFGDAADADLKSRADEMESYADGGDEGRHDRSMFAAGMRRSAALIEHGDVPAMAETARTSAAEAGEEEHA